MLHNLIFNGKNEDLESLIIQLEVENHEQLTQVVRRVEEINVKVGIDIDGEHVPLHDDEVFRNTQ
jgi:ribosomal protein S10